MAKGKSKCLCGCGKQVTHETQLRHLRGEGTMAAKVALQHKLNVAPVLSQGVQKRHHTHQHRSRHPSSLPEMPLDNVEMQSPPPGSPSPPPAFPDHDDDTQESIEQPGEDSSDEEDWSGQAEGNALGFDAAPWLRGLSAVDILSEQFDLERARQGFHLSEKDMKDIRTFNYIVDTSLGAGNYKKLTRSGLIDNLETLYHLHARICFLTGVKPVDYHCCVNSCCCFTRQYSNLDHCPHCSEARYDSRGRPRNVFQYIPIIPRLVNLFLDVATISKMQYRGTYSRARTGIADTFDGEHYQRLLKEFVRIGEEQLGHRFFELLTDIALALSTDGVGPFKSRKQTCWPLLIFNLNLPPEIRFHLVNIICVGVIPGPKAPVDMDSFLWPLFVELEALMRGVPAFDQMLMRKFSLHAYLLHVFGDMPAISKLMKMKGVNGYSPCRMCGILGIADPRKPRTLYTPLTRPTGDSYCPDSLPLRTHTQFLRQAIEVDTATNDASANQRSRLTGINGIPLLSTLTSLAFPASFPFDFMHLVENIMPTLVAHWTGTFKEMSTATDDYIISTDTWEVIGADCKAAGDTLPSAFGSRVPNIATERYQFKAENWFAFLMFLGPALLHKRLKTRYYNHFLDLVKLFNQCLAYVLSYEEVDEIEAGFIKWVKDYERLYYRNDLSRVSACTLPIHSLLHIARDIREIGPVWCYWNFPTERFCGAIVRAVQSRKHPFVSMAHRLRDVAQLSQLKVMYSLTQTLDLSDSRADEGNGLSVANYSNLVLVVPHRDLHVDDELRRKVAAYLATNLTNGLTTTQVLRHVPTVLNAYGKVKFLNGGDMIHSALTYSISDSEHRDASFVKYVLEVDRNASRPRREVDMVETAFYGQVQHYFTLDLPEDFPFATMHHHEGQQACTLVLALIHPVKRSKDNSTRTPCYHQFAAAEVVDIGAILGLVGRVWNAERRRWLLVGRPEVMALIDGATYGA